MLDRCAEYVRLEGEVEEALSEISEVSTLQLELFRSRSFN